MHSILGIRHHGPGSARSVRTALERIHPDIVLVEGPPDADGLIPLALQADMIPPVAILLYAPDRPQQAIYYPFAEFSPEWQALQYALRNNLPARFMDLPQANQLGESSEAKPVIRIEIQNEDLARVPQPSFLDPFALIAEAAGYSDGERWWEHFVEQRRYSGDVFPGILELMVALRTETSRTLAPDNEQNLAREAAMRTILRSSIAEGFQKIAVVCGAWHAPALLEPDSYENDALLLKGLPRVEVSATWIPWTYDRLSRRSGYGAGIESPGWYEHIWQTESLLVEKWMVKVAQLMRSEDLGISPAHAIEATRLAEALAALRDRPLPGLAELNEAVQAIFCSGDDAPMRLIREQLIVGQRMGTIPAAVLTVPLQRDLIATQKHVRLEPSASPETIDLDLRKPLLLERSQLLHRLNVLGIPWGQLQTARGAKGTFHEIWQIEWKPEFAVVVIEASLWGNTVLEAASNKIADEAAHTNELPALTRLVEAAMLADLAGSMPELMSRLQQVAAASGDVPHLMEALPPLANVLRYGNVRQTDTSIVRHVVDEFVTRICIGLPPACLALDDDAARAMFERINAVQNAITILQVDSHLAAWTRLLNVLAGQEEVHGLVRGRFCRLSFDSSEQDSVVAVSMSRALSLGTPAAQAAAWVEGFLHGSGQALIHHPRLWRLVDEWLMSLSEATFTSLLPILRRTFSAFPAPERRQIGEMAKHGGLVFSTTGEVASDPARVEKALALVIRILNKG